MEKTPRQEQEGTGGHIRIELEHSPEITRKDLFVFVIKMGLNLFQQ